MSAIFLTHNTARQFWQLATNPTQWKRSRRMFGSKQSGAPTKESVAAARHALCRTRAFDEADELHLMVDSRTKRRDIRGVVCHATPCKLPEKSFVQIYNDVFVASPELLFAIEANRLGLIKTIQFGFEICGRYAAPPANLALRLARFNRKAANEFEERGFFDRKPLTSVAKIGAFLKRVEGFHGARTAARALPHVIDGSASPMESVAAMFLCLPFRYGGFGIDHPLMNARVDMTGKTAALSTVNSYECDMLWPDASLVIEYDSELEHATKQRIAKDSRKRIELLAQNLAVITLTKHQIYHAPSMEIVAREVARLTGKRIRKGTFELTDERIALRKTILWDRIDQLKREQIEAGRIERELEKSRRQT